jgi:hypothetical protein
MSRSHALAWTGALVWTAALMGCQAGPPATDPFLNPTRIPPPTTGDITPIQPGMVGVPGGQPPVVVPGTGYAPPAGSYNQGNAGGSIYATPPAGNQGYGAVPNATAPYSAPGYGAPATQTPTYPTPRTQTPPYTYPAPAQQPGSGSIYNNRQSSFDRSVGAPTRASTTSGTMTVARSGADGDSGSRTAAPTAAAQDGTQIDTRQIVQASYANPAAEAPQVQPRRSTRGNGPVDRGETYGFEPNYAWLHGKLEYSQVQGQWKLRYIPLDGETDRYGGSVVLAGEAPLAGHKPGEFVSVTGAIVQQAGGQEGFAPTYRVDQIVRLSD